MTLSSDIFSFDLGHLNLWFKYDIFVLWLNNFSLNRHFTFHIKKKNYTNWCDFFLNYYYF